MCVVSTAIILGCLFLYIWVILFTSVTLDPNTHIELKSETTTKDSSNSIAPKIQSDVHHPRREPLANTWQDSSAPTLTEIQKNMTVYLHTLHKRLGDLAGPTVTAEAVWEEYLDVTKSTLIRWDDENKHRLPKQKIDNSIFVSLGTYRDPYCPMTIKSLFAKAKYPEKLFIGLLQQNCFEKKCRTGVLVGGKVDFMDTDVDCYKEFCKSVEGQQSNACNTGQIRLFNVNESESLGPYMARYLGAKFYR